MTYTIRPNAVTQPSPAWASINDAAKMWDGQPTTYGYTTPIGNPPAGTLVFGYLSFPSNILFGANRVYIDWEWRGEQVECDKPENRPYVLVGSTKYIFPSQTVGVRKKVYLDIPDEVNTQELKVYLPFLKTTVNNYVVVYEIYSELDTDGVLRPTSWVADDPAQIEWVGDPELAWNTNPNDACQIKAKSGTQWTTIKGFPTRKPGPCQLRMKARYYYAYTPSTTEYIQIRYDGRETSWETWTLTALNPSLTVDLPGHIDPSKLEIRFPVQYSAQVQYLEIYHIDLVWSPTEIKPRILMANTITKTNPNLIVKDPGYTWGGRTGYTCSLTYPTNQGTQKGYVEFSGFGDIGVPLGPGILKLTLSVFKGVSGYAFANDFLDVLDSPGGKILGRWVLSSLLQGDTSNISLWIPGVQDPSKLTIRFPVGYEAAGNTQAWTIYKLLLHHYLQGETMERYRPTTWLADQTFPGDFTDRTDAKHGYDAFWEMSDGRNDTWSKVTTLGSTVASVSWWGVGVDWHDKNPLTLPSGTCGFSCGAGYSAEGSPTPEPLLVKSKPDGQFVPFPIPFGEPTGENIRKVWSDSTPPGGMSFLGFWGADPEAAEITSYAHLFNNFSILYRPLGQTPGGWFATSRLMPDSPPGGSSPGDPSIPHMTSSVSYQFTYISKPNDYIVMKLSSVSDRTMSLSVTIASTTTPLTLTREPKWFRLPAITFINYVPVSLQGSNKNFRVWDLCLETHTTPSGGSQGKKSALASSC